MNRLSRVGTEWSRFHHHSILGSFSSTSVSYRCFWSSWSSSTEGNNAINTNKNKNDSIIIERYRFQQPTSSMITEFRSETERTIQSLDPTVCQQMLDRIHKVVETDLQQEQDEEDTDEAAAAAAAASFDGEPGPTGKWLYRLDVLDNDNNRRVYHRHSAFERINSDDNKNQTKQVVLELEATVELLAMSLTPDEDESCVAALVQRHENVDENGKATIVNEIRIRNIETGVEKRIRVPTKESNPIAETVTSLEWGSDVIADNDATADTLYPHHTICFLYTNHQGQPNRVLSARINPETMNLINDELPTTIFYTDDPKVMVSLQRTKGGKFVSIEASTKTSNEIFLSTGDPSSPLQLVKSREKDIMYHVDVGPVVNNEQPQEEAVVMLVGDDQLYEVPVSSLPVADLNNPTTTKAYVSSNETNEHSISDIDIFRRHIVLYERSRRTGNHRIRTINREDSNNDNVSNSYVVDLPSPKISPWTKITPFGNIQYNSTTLTFRLESPVDPGIEYELDFETSEVNPPPHSPRPTDYSYEKVFVKSQDGTDIPLSIFCKTEESNEDVLLACYGAYGEAIGYDYNPIWKSLLDSGLVVAFAHTRGGNELGSDWHHAATKEKKAKGIDDLEACAEYLKSRFSQRNLSAYAYSAGGILVGAAVNRHPGLFDKVVLINSFLDVLATMKNPSLFLTEHEYDEFGNPSNDERIEAAMSSYCPISNLIPEDQKRCNTKFFITGTLDDANVPYWNSAIYFHKLLETSNGNSSDIDASDRNRPWLFMNFDGGHHLDGRRQIEIHSYIMAFLLTAHKER